jgi:drug/metabolite transporter (DMT)-like permease
LTFLIAIRVLLSVSASAIQKYLMVGKARPVPIWVATYALMLPITLFAAAFTWSRPPQSFWVDSLLGGILDALGNLAMIAALRAADLSVFGPLNAIRPMLALLFGWIFLREQPTSAGLAGIFITVLGAIIVLKEDRRQPSSHSSIFTIVGFRLLGFALSTVAAVFLKRAASTVSAEMTLVGWTACGLVCLLAYAFWRREQLTPATRDKWIFLHAATFLIMQWLTIKIFQATLLSYAFVFFQLGMILQVVAGKVFFGERHFTRRLIGCAIMSAGAVLIALRG